MLTHEAANRPVLLHPLSDATVAEFERSLLLERQREGIAIAKAKGAYKGRKPALDDDVKATVVQRLSMGERNQVGPRAGRKPSHDL